MRKGIGTALVAGIVAASVVLSGLLAGMATARPDAGTRDLKVAAKAEDYALEHWGSSYGGYWVVDPFPDDHSEKVFFFAFKNGLRHHINKLARLYPLEASRYRAVLNRYSWNFLLHQQKVIGHDAKLMRKGKLKVPVDKPWKIGSYPDPERDCVAVERYPLEPAFVKWAKNRWGATVCLDQVASGW